MRVGERVITQDKLREIMWLLYDIENKGWDLAIDGDLHTVVPGDLDEVGPGCGCDMCVSILPAIEKIKSLLPEIEMMPTEAEVAAELERFLNES